MVPKKKWMTILGSAVLAGVLATGVAFAAGGDAVNQAINKRSPGVQELKSEIRSLREKRLQELKAEIDGLIDKAQAEGRITADEATRLKEHGKKGFGMGRKGGHGFKGGMRGFPRGASEAEVKAKLEEAVKNGRITQEQADRMLQKWRDWNATKQFNKES